MATGGPYTTALESPQDATQGPRLLLQTYGCGHSRSQGGKHLELRLQDIVLEVGGEAGKEKA